MLQESVRDSLRSHGEECVVLAMYHVANHAGIVPRCPDCYDEVYATENRADCTRCWGTSFDGGVAQAARAWMLISGADNDETFRREGVWANNKRQVQIESYPELTQHDYIVRVKSWSRDHRPQAIDDIFVTGVMNVTSLRTGGRYGEYATAGVGQVTTLDHLPPEHLMYRYPVIGQKFDRLDGKER